MMSGKWFAALLALQAVSCAGSNERLLSYAPAFADCQDEARYAHLSAVRDRGTASPQVYAETVRLLISEGLIQDAAGWIAEAAARYPHDVDLLVAYAELWHAIEGPSSPQSASALRKALALEPNAPHVRLQLGYAHLAAGEDEDAGAMFANVIQGSSVPFEVASAYLGLASLHTKKNDPSNATRYVNLALEIIPELYDVLSYEQIRSMSRSPEMSRGFHQVSGGSHPTLQERLEQATRFVRDAEQHDRGLECAGLG